HSLRKQGRGRQQTGGLQAGKGASLQQCTVRLSQNRNERDLPFQQGHGSRTSEPDMLDTRRNCVCGGFGEH
ncbi:MAG: hypothetical protein ACKOB3_04655, partial [Holophagaceae bacterium]